MVERPTNGPLPPAHPVLYGRSPLPDGDTVPQPPPPPLPLATREVVYGWICVGIILVAPIVAAILR